MEPGTPVQWQYCGRLFKGVVVEGPVDMMYTVCANFHDYLGKEQIFTIHQEKLLKLS
jgi:hypothetical protein